MSRTTSKWVIAVLVVIIIILLAWNMGWLGMPAAGSDSQSAAVANATTLLSDSAITQSTNIIDAELKLAQSDLATFIANPNYTELATTTVNFQVGVTLLSQLRSSLVARMNSQNISSPSQYFISFDQDIGMVNSQLYNVMNAVQVNKNLPGPALHLTETRLQAALVALQQAETIAKAIAKNIALKTH